MVVVTFAAAAFGSFLAVALESWLARRGSRAHYEALRRALSNEVGAIATEARERAKRSQADLRLDPLYPTSAWESMVESPEVRRLNASYTTLADFYSTVYSANHRTDQVAILLQISATASDDTLRLSFRGLAQVFSASAQGAVLHTLPAAEKALADQGR